MADNQIVIKQGLNFDAIIEAFDDDAMQQRTELLGWRVVFQARSRAGAEDTILDLATDDDTGRLVIEQATDGPVGYWLRMHLDAEQTADLSHPGVFGIVRIDPDNPANVDPIMDDRFLVERATVML